MNEITITLRIKTEYALAGERTINGTKVKKSATGTLVDYDESALAWFLEYDLTRRMNNAFLTSAEAQNGGTFEFRTSATKDGYELKNDFKTGQGGGFGGPSISDMETAAIASGIDLSTFQAMLEKAKELKKERSAK